MPKILAISMVWLYWYFLLPRQSIASMIHLMTWMLFFSSFRFQLVPLFITYTNDAIMMRMMMMMMTTTHSEISRTSHNSVEFQAVSEQRTLTRLVSLMTIIQVSAADVIESQYPMSHSFCGNPSVVSVSISQKLPQT